MSLGIQRTRRGRDDIAIHLRVPLGKVVFLGEVWIIDSPGEVLLDLAGEGSAGAGEPEDAGGPPPGSRALPAGTNCEDNIVGMVGCTITC